MLDALVLALVVALVYALLHELVRALLHELVHALVDVLNCTLVDVLNCTLVDGLVHDLNSENLASLRGTKLRIRMLMCTTARKYDLPMQSDNFLQNINS